MTSKKRKSYKPKKRPYQYFFDPKYMDDYLNDFAGPPDVRKKYLKKSDEPRIINHLGLMLRNTMDQILDERVEKFDFRKRITVDDITDCCYCVESIVSKEDAIGIFLSPDANPNLTTPEYIFPIFDRDTDPYIQWKNKKIYVNEKPPKSRQAKSCRSKRKSTK